MYNGNISKKTMILKKKKSFLILFIVISIFIFSYIKIDIIFAKLSDYLYDDLCIKGTCFKKPDMYLAMYANKDGSVKVINIDISLLLGGKQNHEDDVIYLYKKFDNSKLAVTAKIFKPRLKYEGETIIENAGCLFYLNENKALFLLQIPEKNIEFHMYTKDQNHIHDIKENLCIKLR